MANGGTAQTTIDAELQAEALQRFNPLVFTFSLETGNNICFPKLIEAMTRDPALAKGFYVLDRKGSTSPPPPLRGKHGERRSKQMESIKGNVSQFYDDYVRIAVEREIKRREEVQARETEYAALFSLYVEDGLTEAEAAEAARKEMEEVANEGTSSEEGDVRDRLYVLIPMFPTNMEEVTELHDNGLPLHAVVSLSSRVALSGSAAAERPLQASDTTKGKEKKESKKPVSKERNVHIEEKNQTTLAAELQQYLERVKNPLPHLKSICIHEFDVPTEVVPTGFSSNATSATAASNMTGDTTPAVVYRLKGTEGAVFSAIVDAVVMLEESYIGFCEWKAHRVRVDVPSYVPLRYPQTVEASTPAVEERGRKKSVIKKKSTISVPVVPAVNVEPIPVFDAEPKNMKGVVAHRSVYDTVLSTWKQGYFNKQAFRAACALQITATMGLTNPELLEPFPNLAKRERQQMLKDRKESNTYVKYIFEVATRGVDNTHHQFFSETGEMGPTGRGSLKDVIPIKTTSSSVSSQPKDHNGVLSPSNESNVVGTSRDIREAAVSLMSESFGMEMEHAREMLTNVTSFGFIHSAGREVTAQVLERSSTSSWRRAQRKIGCCELEVAYRGDGLPRTESSVYNFCGSATFADYVNWQKYCTSERLHYNPPPPDSDEEEPSEEEEEEEEEEEYEEQAVDDVDDKEGGEKNTVKVKKTLRQKKVQELQPVDLLEVADAALRRRRTYEDILKRLCQKDDVVQEVITSGSGAHCIAEEREWMFTEDGSTIEVRRILGNTPQVYCTVSDSVDLAFGFLTMEEPYTEEVPLVISSNLRGFLTIDHVVRFFFEVVADNTSAVEQAAYTKALEAAKLEAKAQHDALEQTKTSKNAKDKAPIPTLAALEEALVSQIPVPNKREQPKPMTSARALFQDGTIITFCAAEKCLHVAAVRSLLHPSLVNLIVDVCVGGVPQSIRVTQIDAITVYADGCVLVQSQDVGGYRVSFDVFGNYVTVNAEGTMLYVTASGKRSIVHLDGQTLDVEPLKVTTTVNRPTGAYVLLRQDGAQVALGSEGRTEKVTYGTGFSCKGVDGGYAWRLMGFPEFRVYLESGQLSFTVDRMETIMDIEKQTLRVIHHRSGGEAVLDWTSHRLHVRTVPSGNCFTVDCAFGGLVASSDVMDYCVSPFGRCGEGRENVFKEAEIVNKEFLHRYEENGGNFGEMALQSNSCIFDFPIKAVDADCNPTLKPTTTTLSSYLRFAEGSLDTLRASGVRQSKDLLRVVVRISGSDGEDGTLIFMNPWLSSVLLQRLKRDINPTYSRLFPGVSLHGGALQEHIVFLGSSHGTALGEEDSTATMASSVAQLFLMSELPKATQPPREDKVSAIHFLSAREGTVLMTEELAALLHHDHISSSDVETWSKAMQRVPLVETADAAMGNSSGETQRLLPLRAFVVCRPSVKSAASSHKKQRGTPDTKYNYWRSTGVVVAAEMKEATSNDQGGNASASNSELESKHVPTSVATPPAAGESLSNKEHNSWVPFMHSTVEKDMPPRELRFVPSLSATPSVLSFGRLVRGNRYALPLSLTNTSTVPCRYRVTVPVEYRSFVCIHYPRHFLAPGLAVLAQVEISGTQPLGSTSVVVSVSHEGGVLTVTVNLETVEEEEEVLPPIAGDSKAVLLGPTLVNSFVPGTTKRLPPHVLLKETVSKEGSPDTIEPM